MIAVIDYGMGNLRSVLNGFQALGEDARKVTDPSELRSAEAIVLPGVGAFGDGMANLHRLGFIPALEEEVLRKQKPFLGICLGLQLLASRGLEHGDFKGLQWIPGVVERITIPESDPQLRIPHIGWNDVRFIKRNGLYDGLGEGQSFYFVHSFALRPDNPEVISGVVSYGTDLVASVEKDNISATQFHPEKSHQAGLQILKNWCAKVVKC